MQLSVDIPDTLSRAFGTEPKDLSRAAIEALAVEAYRSHRVTTEQLRVILGFDSRPALDAFLKDRHVWLDYTVEDLERDRESIRKAGF